MYYVRNGRTQTPTKLYLHEQCNNKLACFSKTYVRSISRYRLSASRRDVPDLKCLAADVTVPGVMMVGGMNYWQSLPVALVSGSNEGKQDGSSGLRLVVASGER